MCDFCQSVSCMWLMSDKTRTPVAKLVRNIIAGIGKRRLAQDGKETKQIVTLLGSPWDWDSVRCVVM